MNLEIGKIIKTVGLKGEMKIYPITTELEQRFKVGKRVFIGNMCYQIKSFRMQKGCPIIKLSSIDTIELAQPLIGSVLTVDVKDLPEIDGHYGYELKHYDVIYGDQLVGKVKGFESFGAQVNMRLDLLNGKSVLIPFIDPFSENIDDQVQCIVMKNLAGLL